MTVSNWEASSRRISGRNPLPARTRVMKGEKTNAHYNKSENVMPQNSVIIMKNVQFLFNIWPSLFILVGPEFN